MLVLLLHLLMTYILFWLTGFFLCVAFFRRKIDLRTAAIPTQVLFPLFGYLAMIQILLFASVLGPVSKKAMILLLAHLAGVSLIRWKMLVQIAQTIRKPSFSQAGTFGLLFLLLWIAASQSPGLPDMWGYHVQAIQWIHQYPAIPGLGNLCPKFAFNFASFLPAALFSFPFLNGEPIYSSNFFLMLLLLLQVVRMEKLMTGLKYLLILLAFAWLLHYFKEAIPTTSVELSSASLILLAFLLTVESRLQASLPYRLYVKVLLLMLLIALPLVKLTNLMFLLLIPVVWNEKTLKKNFLPAFLLILFWLPWFARSYILTGWLVYPLPWLDLFDPDWKVPAAQAWDDFYWIRSWARIPFLPHEEVLSLPFRSWFGQWVQQSGPLPLFFILSGLAAFVLTKCRKLSAHAWPAVQMRFWMVSLATLICWFVLAPDPRFAVASLLLFSLIPLLQLAEGRISGLFSKALTTKTALILVLSFFLSEMMILRPLHIPPGIRPLPYPSAAMKSVKVDWLEVHTPIAGVNCYHYPLPSAPHIPLGLEMRGSEITAGFKREQVKD
ncbi:MAG TPA: hypothetical protein P5531_12220 [Bacteroidales bacterium]|nr:hypothetical protein [Bacteroidales bacterium]HSA44275.1 hypothetical protein [Bacteroidales bacterium]